MPKKVENYLVKSELSFDAFWHRKVYTAFDKAATLKIKQGLIAKVLVVKLDKELAMAVVGGDRNLDIGKLLKLSRPKGRGSLEATKKIDFAKEKIICETFKGIDPGAIPPFAGLWNMKVFCDKKLLKSPKIIFSAGNYEASLKITPGAFKKINQEMIIGSISKVKEKLGKSKKTVGRKPVAAAKNKRKK